MTKLPSPPNFSPTRSTKSIRIGQSRSPHVDITPTYTTDVLPLPKSPDLETKQVLNVQFHLLEFLCSLTNNVCTFSFALQGARHELLNVDSALWPITDRKWVACAATKLPSRPKSLKLINQQLWCCCGWSGIVVFDIKRHHQFNIARGEMGKVYDVAQMSNGNVLIATPSGLYHTDATGI